MIHWIAGWLLAGSIVVTIAWLSDFDPLFEDLLEESLAFWLVGIMFWPLVLFCMLASQIIDVVDWLFERKR